MVITPHDKKKGKYNEVQGCVCYVNKQVRDKTTHNKPLWYCTIFLSYTIIVGISLFLYFRQIILMAKVVFWLFKHDVKGLILDLCV